MLKRILLVLLLFIALAVAAGFGFLYWVTTPAGAEGVSRCLSKAVAKQVPGTRIRINRITFMPHFSTQLDFVKWEKESGGTILRSDRMDLSIDPEGFTKGRLDWMLQGNVEAIDLALLDEKLAQGEWQAVGAMEGPVRISGRGGELGEVSIDLQSTASGGTLSGAIITRLVEMMPQGSTQAQVAQALQGQKTFRYNIGKFRVSTDGGTYKLNLFLDGDHLLDFTVNVEKDSVGVLSTLLGGISG
jgi:hypothetical protein